MAADTTSTLSNEMQQYLVRVFLERSQALNIHAEGAKTRKHERNSGKSITWNRYTPSAAATTALTEATNPAETSITGATVTATLAEYGNWYKISSLLYGTSIDREAKEKVELASQNASETIDTLVRNELFTGGTVQFANSKSSLANLAATDTFTSTEIRKAVRQLKKNNAITYDDGYFLGKVGPDTAFDLFADPTWVNAHTYKDGKELYKGEIGKLHKVRFLEASSNQRSEASTVTVYSNFIHGKEAFGTVDLSGDAMKLIIKNSDKGDTSNPLNMFMAIGWKTTFATKTLNSNWIINVKSGASS
ncbi:N4-gp56 family major capsid protein [Candidatus Saccharibacteria bacterium]|nr:N4-gp56 family major capsid protein [Candidatus Saccharibacteria bacterium]